MPESARRSEAAVIGRGGPVERGGPAPRGGPADLLSADRLSADRVPTPEDRARDVVLRYKTLDSDHRPPLMTMIAEAIREAEQVIRQQERQET